MVRKKINNKKTKKPTTSNKKKRQAVINNNRKRKNREILEENEIEKDIENESPMKIIKYDQNLENKLYNTLLLNNNNNQQKFTGTFSRAVYEIPIKISTRIRKNFYSLDLGYPFPFSYDANKNVLNLQPKADINFSDINYTNYFAQGPLDFTNTTDDDDGEDLTDNINSLYIPIIKEKINSKTSQGKVFSAIVNLKEITSDNSNDKISTIIIIKVDSIKPKNQLWWLSHFNNNENNNNVVLNTNNGSYTVIDTSYMDALCSILLSNLFEKKISPHFPACYCSYIANIIFKNNNTLQTMNEKKTPTKSKKNNYKNDNKLQPTTTKTNKKKMFHKLFVWNIYNIL